MSPWTNGISESKYTQKYNCRVLLLTFVCIYDFTTYDPSHLKQPWQGEVTDRQAVGHLLQGCNVCLALHGVSRLTKLTDWLPWVDDAWRNLSVLTKRLEDGEMEMERNGRKWMEADGNGWKYWRKELKRIEHDEKRKCSAHSNASLSTSAQESQEPMHARQASPREGWFRIIWVSKFQCFTVSTNVIGNSIKTTWQKKKTVTY